MSAWRPQACQLAARQYGCWLDAVVRQMDGMDACCMATVEEFDICTPQQQSQQQGPTTGTSEPFSWRTLYCQRGDSGRHIKSIRDTRWLATWPHFCRSSRLVGRRRRQMATPRPSPIYCHSVARPLPGGRQKPINGAGWPQAATRVSTVWLPDPYVRCYGQPQWSLSTAVTAGVSILALLVPMRDLV